MDLPSLILDIYIKLLRKPSTPDLQWPIGSSALGFKEGMIDALGAFFLEGASQGFLLGVVTVLVAEFIAVVASATFAAVLILFYLSHRRSVALKGLGRGLLPLVLCLMFTGPAFAQKETKNGPIHEGQAVDCDLPQEIRVRNTVGINGMGLCVWASLEMNSRYLNCTELIGNFDDMKRKAGGGWPDRVDKIMAARAPNVGYEQYLGADVAFVQDWINTGRPVCVTFGYGELYHNRTIAHMVLCVAMTPLYTGILDNNDPENIYWMSTEEFSRRFSWPRGQGWAFAIMTPPPPPVPHSRKALALESNPSRLRLVRAGDGGDHAPLSGRALVFDLWYDPRSFPRVSPRPQMSALPMRAA